MGAIADKMAVALSAASAHKIPVLVVLYDIIRIYMT